MGGHVRQPVRLAGALSLLALSVVMSGRPIAANPPELDPEVVTVDQKAVGRSLRNDPPKFLFSEQPAILVLIDGEPVYRAVEGTDLQRVVNATPFIIRDMDGTHYMKVFDGWMQASASLGCGRRVIRRRGLCRRCNRPSRKNRRPVGRADSWPAGRDAALEPGTVGTIFVSTEPAELIVTNGQLRFAGVEGSSLKYVENTTADVFREPTDDELYVLSSGRWFRAWKTNGPWQFVASNQLPADFAAIPDGSPKASVKASIAGTAQAKEALTRNAVPQMATIDRHQTRIMPFIDDDPRLEPIDGTGLSWVVNSPTPIIMVNSPAEYYAVQDGVWFVSTSIGGPWTVASSVPPAVYMIPSVRRCTRHPRSYLRRQLGRGVGRIHPRIYRHCCRRWRRGLRDGVRIQALDRQALVRPSDDVRTRRALDDLAVGQLEVWLRRRLERQSSRLGVGSLALVGTDGMGSAWRALSVDLAGVSGSTGAIQGTGRPQCRSVACGDVDQHLRSMAFRRNMTRRVSSIVASIVVVFVTFRCARAADALILRVIRPPRGEVLLASDVILATAFGVAVYLWLRLRVTRTRLTGLERAQVVLDTQLSLAADIQRHLLPPIPVRSNGVRWAGRLVPAYSIGGDFYDFIPAVSGSLSQAADADGLFVVGDVSGKGIPAALLQASAHSLFRTLARDTVRPRTC